MNSVYQRSLVLLGAGNAHLIVVKKWGMRPPAGVRLVLINDRSTVAYSGMVPGCLSGKYARHEIEIDLRRLCRASGVTFIEGRATKIDRLGKKIECADRSPITYDLLSINLGSHPKKLPGAALNDSESTKPLASLIERMDRVVAEGRPRRIVVVGGGAGGVEIALALATRLSSTKSQLALVHGGKSLGGDAARVSRWLEKKLRAAGVTLSLGQPATEVSERGVQLASGEWVPGDLIVWATQASAPEMFRESGFSTDENGFLKVSRSLQSSDDPVVFGAGDCVAIAAYPNLPRSGVYSVRQGPLLFKNLVAQLEGERLEKFRPQRRAMAILDTVDGAILRYGKFSARGNWVRSWKESIDLAWVKKFSPGADHPMLDAAAKKMRCGGCGSKVGGRVLDSVLCGPSGTGTKAKDILLDAGDGEDASAHRPTAGKIELQTIDYFKSFIDDDYTFGRIAAVHAMSDIYAMNGRPRLALALATLPVGAAHLQQETLAAILAGARREFDRAGVSLGGGHTSEGTELGLGFSVTGYVDEEKMFYKGRLKKGDRLVLTKPLGTGVLLAGAMRGLAGHADFENLMQTMLRSNGPAAELFGNYGGVAATDVTGFGLAGHLLEMLRASAVSARIDVACLPILPGAWEMSERGIRSTLFPENARSASDFRGSVPDLFFDPQTSGGLLLGVRENIVDKLLAELIDAGDRRAAVIGEVTENGEERSVVTIVGQKKL